MKARSPMLRTVSLATAFVALLLAAGSVSPATGAVGDFTVTYDWFGKQNLGFDGWAPAVLEDPSGAPLETPYYAALMDSSSGTASERGIQLLPSVSSGGLGTRLYPNFDSSAQEGGPRIKLPWKTPGSSTFDSAKFEHVDFSNNHEGQILSLTSFNGNGNILDVVPFIKPKYAPGPPDLNVTETLSGPAAHSLQLMLRTICDQNNMVGSCPNVAQPPASYGKIRKVTISLKDPEKPVVGKLTGTMVAPGWLKPGGSYKFSFTASDGSSGIKKLAYVKPGGKKGFQAGFCNRDHQPNQDFRPGAECPKTGSLGEVTAAAPSKTGTYKLTVSAFDDSDRETKQTVVVNVDHTGPVVKLASSSVKELKKFSNGRTPLEVAFDLSDKHSGVKSLRLLKGTKSLKTPQGQELGTVDLCGGKIVQCPPSRHESVVFDTSDLSSGVNVLEARVTDLIGNTKKFPFKVKVDRQGPAAPEFVGKRASVSDGRVVVTKFKKAKDRPAPPNSETKSHTVRIVGKNILDQVAGPVKASGTQARIVLPKGVKLPPEARVAVAGIDGAGNLGIVATNRIIRTDTRLKTKGKSLPAKRPPGLRRVIYGISEPQPQHVFAGARLFNPADPGLFKPDSSIEGGAPYNESDPNSKTELDQRAAVRAAFDNLRFHDETGSHDVEALRVILPYDLWVNPAKRPNEKDDYFQERERKTHRLRANLKQFVDLLGAKDAAGRPMQIYVTLMSSDFVKCNGKEVYGGTGEKIVLEEIKSIKDDRISCTYPDEKTFGEYFKQWLRANYDYYGCRIRAWGAWNEPDQNGFTLMHVAPNGKGAKDKIAGARYAARYWKVAQRLASDPNTNPCGPANYVVAGEFGHYNQLENSSAFVESYMREIFASGSSVGKVHAPLPTVWSVHNYRDLLPTDIRELPNGPDGIKRNANDPKERRTNSALNFTGLIDRAIKTGGSRIPDAAKRYEIWLTETGVLLQPNRPMKAFYPGTTIPRVVDGVTQIDYRYTGLWGKPKQQYQAGIEFTKLHKVSPKITRVFYYLSRAGRPGAVSNPPGFDSAYTDDTGHIRPAYCGFTGQPDNTNCPGSPVSNNPNP